VAILAVAALVSGILIALGVISSPYPQIIGKNCGTITAGEGGRAGDFTSSEQCLWTAYQTCQAATLVYHDTGLDFTLSHAVSVQQHGARCSVTDATQGEGSVGRPTRHSYQCSGMEQQVRGLVILHCGAEGDITIPSASMARGRGGRRIDAQTVA
jgi:hypothetical protein